MSKLNAKELMDLIDELLKVKAEEPKTKNPSKKDDLATEDGFEDLKQRVVRLEAASDCDVEILADLKADIHELNTQINDLRERLADVEDYVYSEDDEDLCDGEDCDECDLNEECSFCDEEDEDEEEGDDFSIPKIKVVAIAIDTEEVGKILVNLIKELTDL